MAAPDEELVEEDELEEEMDEEEGGGFDDLSEADQQLLAAAENRSHYAKTGPARLPQPPRGSSVPNLPKVRATSFKRTLR